MKSIRFENVSKKFKIGQHVTLKRKFGDLVDKVWRPGAGAAPSPRRVLWAVREVSFEVDEGETLGLIGPNGSGKSTTLKLLAKIMEPDSGVVDIRGSVVPLIEVGAGFHQDLSGRENIYLNGSILGLKKADIDRHFDHIVEFAEISQFIDTPLKKYSSGMAVRLGFAIAVHINPDVLLVDEVLAVGDIRFQRKCIAKMKEVVRNGKTVVFVSHNMTAVQSLCKRCVLLFNGKVVACGESQNVVNSYLTNSYSREVPATTSTDSRSMICSFLSAQCEDKAGNRISSIRHGDDLIITTRFLLTQSVGKCRFYVTIHGADGITVYETDTWRHGRKLDLQAGTHRIRVLFPRVPLLPAVYSFSVSVSDMDNSVSYGFAFHVTDFEVKSDRPDSSFGMVALPTEWELPDGSSQT